MNRRLSFLIFLLLGVGCFTLAAVIQPRTSGWSRRSGSDSLLTVLLGDGRKLFANHFFVKADVYFHSGYYPGIFDQAAAPKDSRHMTADEHNHEEHDAHDEHDNHAAEAASAHPKEETEHERLMAFLGPPRDWIERFGRRFMISEHTHLAGSEEREILPWLKISSQLDPQRIDTYTVASYWLRKELGKPEEAEKFLREGLRHNPNSYELLFELGRLQWENHKDAQRARNLWELALRRWHEQQDNAKEPDLISLEQITVHLARLEEDQGDFVAAIGHLETALRASPAPDVLRKQIEELRQKLPPSK